MVETLWQESSSENMEERTTSNEEYTQLQDELKRLVWEIALAKQGGSVPEELQFDDWNELM